MQKSAYPPIEVASQYVVCVCSRMVLCALCTVALLIGVMGCVRSCLADDHNQIRAYMMPSDLNAIEFQSQFEYETEISVPFALQNSYAWENRCDLYAGDAVNLNLLSLCAQYAPTPVYVVGDELSTKIMNQLKNGTVTMLNTTGLSVVFRWVGVEQHFTPSRQSSRTGFAIEVAPSLNDAFLHVHYYFR